MPQNLARRIKAQAAQRVIREKQVEASLWKCCGDEFHTHEAIGRHVHASHGLEIDQWQERLDHERSRKQNNAVSSESLRKRRAPKGGSDPIGYQCTCDPQRSRVILFYKYAAIQNPESYATEHQRICSELGLTGKVRIASEGINATLAGPLETIETYMDWVVRNTPALKDHDPPLTRGASARHAFFKPSVGCRHVFADLSVKLVDEICPLGRPDQVNLEKVISTEKDGKKLKPEVFHEMLKSEEDVVVLDARNYYESRIGAFRGAVRPAIRKFSKFPDYIDRNREALEGKTILTYCTGGIRCEKATAYMRQVLSPDTKIFMLEGGIHNYLEWIDSSSDKEESMWQGKNYVFDARQALGSSSTTVGRCQNCKLPCDVYKKCASKGCHLLILYCQTCTVEHHHCCNECRDGIIPDDSGGLCFCERQRRIEEMKPLSCQWHEHYVR